MNIDYTVDPSSGIAIVRPANRMFAPVIKGYGSITYRCHSCGELIAKWWETFYFDPDPATAWAAEFLPPVMAPTMTTHHDWHMAATQEA